MRPRHSSPTGTLISFLDRLYAAHGEVLVGKPFGSLTAARRGGTTIALTVLNQYALVGEQPIIPSCYWCMVHGSTPEEVRADAEGMRIAYTLGKRMAEYTQRLC